MFVEVKVQSLGLDRSSNSPVVILEEADGGARPPDLDWSRGGLAPSPTSWPAWNTLAHSPIDLMVAVLNGLGGSLRKVIITREEKSTYYAELIMPSRWRGDLGDARPSDSIAVALRVDARIFVQDALLERATIEISEGKVKAKVYGKSCPLRESPSNQMDPDELKEYLRRLNPEDFGRFTP